MPQNCWRLGLRPRPCWGSLQRSPRPPSCYGLGWRFGNNSNRGQFCALLLVTSAPLFEAGYRPGHRMFDCFEMHICMKHVIYYRLVITLNVAPLNVIDCTELHYFKFEFLTFLRGGAFPDPSLAVVISCFAPMLGGLPPST